MKKSFIILSVGMLFLGLGSCSSEAKTEETKAEETKKYDYTTMSERDLRSLIKDTQDARNEFEIDDPEYEELTTQISLMIDEMKRRGIL